MDGSSGYCQIPGPTEISDYYDEIDDLWAEDVNGCHSADYYDFYALSECSGMSEANLIKYAELVFEWKYRPFIQGETAYACMHAHHPEAPEVIRDK